ncbi:hypothetical protein CJ030_MR2G007344 [Morella rubra]|uniref:Uncharacterized protein n=1 Tax=Morella rubra TaxID=262757 RepID=A0A6A1WFX8_9ROSI|nr:hypothetical protein CJ030_MR2G007344 [Morella rubra]
MIVLSRLASALAVVFAVSLLAIIAQLFCGLRRRGIIRRQCLEDGGNSFCNNSKELLHFCWKKQSRIEPHEAPPTPSPHLGGATTEIDDILKWQVMFGPSRVLFTIKEEEREGVDSENCSSSEAGTKAKRVRKEEVVGVELSLPVVTVSVETEEATPFSTPCASPPYYTPLPSPTREIERSI